MGRLSGPVRTDRWIEKQCVDECDHADNCCSGQRSLGLNRQQESGKETHQERRRYERQQKIIP